MTDQVEKIDLTKKKCVLLLGAGASKEAGLPLSEDLLSNLRVRIKSPSVCRGEYFTKYDCRILKALDNALSHPKPTKETRQYVPPPCNIETLLATLDILSEAPWSLNSTFNIHCKLRRHLRKLYGTTSVGSLYSTYFHGLRSRLYNFIQDQLSLQVAPNETEYLTPLTEFIFTTSADVFTLNYDTLLEQAAGTELPDQVDRYRQHGSFDPSQKPRLFKLHGSLNYEILPLPDDGYCTVRRTDSATCYPAIIAGESKLKQISPFPQMYAEFASSISNAEVLINIGYGGGDNHINYQLALRANRKNASPLVCVYISGKLGSPLACFSTQNLRFAVGRDTGSNSPHVSKQPELWACSLFEDYPVLSAQLVEKQRFTAAAVRILNDHRRELRCRHTQT